VIVAPILQRAHKIVIYPQRDKGIRPRRFRWPAAPFLSDGISWSVHFCPTEYPFAVLRKYADGYRTRLGGRGCRAEVVKQYARLRALRCTE
jgi:hypothetical protein